MKAILYTGNPYYAYITTPSIIASIDLKTHLIRLKQRVEGEGFTILDSWTKTEFTLTEETEKGIMESLPELFL